VAFYALNESKLTPDIPVFFFLIKHTVYCITLKYYYNLLAVVFDFIKKPVIKQLKY